jgi:hypothetical protein
LHEAVRLRTDLLCESATSRYSRRKISTDDELSGLNSRLEYAYYRADKTIQNMVDFEVVLFNIAAA